MSPTQYMQRALELASKGTGIVDPNPMVGCVIVCEDKIIGEGYHHQYGGPHAEVVAINQVIDKTQLQQSVLYVTLEPCAHHGKTPPCSDLIIASKIPHVVIATSDPFAAVNGKGIEKLKAAGIKVEVGLLEEEARFLNRRFFTFHQRKRPYIILKWAQTIDGFLDKKRTIDHPLPNQITELPAKRLLHKWRTEERSILVGKNTVIMDNPQLTARLVQGRQPVRITIDKALELKTDAAIFSPDAETVIFNRHKNEQKNNIRYIKIDFDHTLQELCSKLYELEIQSLIVEGGAVTLQYFINENMWDEARVFTANMSFGEGIKAPQIPLPAHSVESVGNDELALYYNTL